MCNVLEPAAGTSSLLTTALSAAPVAVPEDWNGMCSSKSSAVVVSPAALKSSRTIGRAEKLIAATLNACISCCVVWDGRKCNRIWSGATGRPATMATAYCFTCSHPRSVSELDESSTSTLMNACQADACMMCLITRSTARKDAHWAGLCACRMDVVRDDVSDMVGCVVVISGAGVVGGAVARVALVVLAAVVGCPADCVPDWLASCCDDAADVLPVRKMNISPIHIYSIIFAESAWPTGRRLCRHACSASEAGPALVMSRHAARQEHKYERSAQHGTQQLPAHMPHPPAHATWFAAELPRLLWLHRQLQLVAARAVQRHDELAVPLLHGPVHASKMRAFQWGWKCYGGQAAAASSVWRPVLTCSCACVIERMCASAGSLARLDSDCCSASASGSPTCTTNTSAAACRSVNQRIVRIESNKRMQLINHTRSCAASSMASADAWAESVNSSTVVCWNRYPALAWNSRSRSAPSVRLTSTRSAWCGGSRHRP